MSELGWMPDAERIRGLYRYTGGGENKVGFCDHAAGGFLSTMRDPSFWNEQVQCSVHFAVGREGRRVQLVNIFDRAWGQGRDSRGLSVGPSSPGISWPPFAAMQRRNPNEYLISTEHEDWERVNGQSRAVPGSQWTQAEFDADVSIKRWCIQEVRAVKGVDLLPFGVDSLASHHMFDPVNRANCAGVFWRNEYQRRLWLAISGQEDEMLNIQNESAGFFNGLELPFNVPVHIEVGVDFKWPESTKYGEIQMLILHGYFGVYHGDGTLAKLIGWGNVNEGKAFNETVRVVPQIKDIDGRRGNWISLMAMESNNPVKFAEARGIGYWT